MDNWSLFALAGLWDQHPLIAARPQLRGDCGLFMNRRDDIFDLRHPIPWIASCHMFEKYASIVMILGGLLATIAAVWLIIRAFRVRIAWGVGCLLFPPTILAFCVKHFSQARRPLGLLVLGLLLVGGTVGISQLVSRFPPLGEREKLLDGQVHLTLTGWDRNDYGVLATKPDVVVLQMANPDVTDDTLSHLKTLSKLQEIDLNNSQITDAGLEILASLPNLQVLRLRKTKVTDDGFRKHLQELKTLRELDARDTAIVAKSLREWKNADKEHRKFMK